MSYQQQQNTTASRSASSQQSGNDRLGGGIHHSLQDNRRQQREAESNEARVMETITTLHEAAEAFDLIASRAQRCSLQIATWKAHENQIRKFLVERAVPHAEDALRDREITTQRREEDYNNALLRLKGVNLPAGSSPRMGNNYYGDNNNTNNSSIMAQFSPASRRMISQGMKAREYDPSLGQSLDKLKELSTKYANARGI